VTGAFAARERRPHRLVLVGSVLVDILLYVQTLPERGGDVMAHERIITSGGGFNVLAGAVRLGLPAAYGGRIGDGPMGAQVARDLEAAGIPTLTSRVEDEDTGFDVGIVEHDGERTFITSPGVESRLARADLAALPLRLDDALYVSGYDLTYPISGPALDDWLPDLDDDLLLVVDPGPLVASIPAARLTRVLERTDILSLNARETRLLTGLDDPAAGAQALVGRLRQGGRVVTRIGAGGCWIVAAAEAPVHLPAFPARAVVDTTGAGDAHVAALLASLAAGKDFIEAAWAANVAAALSVERRGPATTPTYAELARRLTTT